jgi:putative membrane protein
VLEEGLTYSTNVGLTKTSLLLGSSVNLHSRDMLESFILRMARITLAAGFEESGSRKHKIEGDSDDEGTAMIKNFTDHAANERTFLAWVRTAIAVMAFGFIVEKFDLFLEVAAPSLAGRTLSIPGQKFGNIAGLALIVLGTAMVAIAAVRFLLTAKNIDSNEDQSASGPRIDVALAALLILLGSALFIYLSHALIATV